MTTKISKQRAYACPICLHYHPVEWDGDCREDVTRMSELPEGWEEVEPPGDDSDNPKGWMEG